jgi:hypothetical protein
MDLFLNPAYMVAGAALISAPIIIHLINRMRYKRIRWAAMEFLLKSQKRNRRRLIIEQLILLALRCLLVALAGFLVARFIGDALTKNQKPVDHFVVVDDTLSTRDRWKDENGETTSFEVAKKKVLEIAKEASKANSPQFLHLVLLSDLTNEVKINDDGRLNQQSLATLESKLNDLKPSKLHVKPAVAVKWAREQESKDPNRQRMLHFVSDLRESDWTGPELDNLNKELEAFTSSAGKVLLFDVAYPYRSERQAVAIHKDNIGISDLRAETRFTAEGLPVQFTATIRNYSAVKKTVFFDVKVDGVARLEVFPTVDLEPGENRHTFQILFNKAGPNMVSAALRDKDESGIPDDNTRVTVIQVKDQVPILMIDGSEDQPNGAHKDSYYLQKLFVEAAKGYRVVVKNRDELDNIDLTPERFPCVYLLDVPDLSDKALKRLEAYVEQGGRVAIFVGDHVKPKFYNDKLYAKGNGIFPVPLEEKKPERISDDEKGKRFIENQYQVFFRDDQHQVFREVADPKFREVFKFLVIDEYWPAQKRLHWNADPTKVQELVTLPNRDSTEGYSAAVNDIRGHLEAKEEKYAKYQPTLDRYRVSIPRAYDESLYALANLLEQFLNDRGDPRNPEKAPDLKDYWDMPENAAFRAKVESLRNTAMYGDPLVVSKAFGKGQTIVFLTTAGKAWNDWAGGSMASPTYPVVMMNLQKYLTSAGDESSRNVGAPLDINLDAESYQDRARVFFQPAPREEREGEKADTGDGSEKEVETVAGKEDAEKQLHFSFTKTREPGVYRVEIKGKPKAGDAREPQPFNEVFVYNVDTENEGNLKRAAKDMLERGSAGQGVLPVALITPDMRLADLLAPKREDMSEAPWLYLVILVVLVIEQALAVHLSFHIRGNEAQLPAGIAGEARTPVPVTEAA